MQAIIKPFKVTATCLPIVYTTLLQKTFEVKQWLVTKYTVIKTR